jgi:alkylation response protein AidB-like acyl-CoA dehydrogenase
MTKRRGFSLERLSGAPLRALTRLSGSDLAARLHLRDPARKVLYHGARVGTQAVKAGAAAMAKRAASDPSRPSASKGSGKFDLTPTDDQAMMRDSMRRFAGEVLQAAARAADDAAGPSDDVLEQAHGLGLSALAVPEALGGVGSERSSVTQAIIAEELSRGDMGLALAILSPVAVAQAIVEWGTGAQQQELLPLFLGDHFAPAALALLEPRPLFDPTSPRTGAVRDAKNGGWALWGEKSLVPLASRAQLFLVAAEVKGVGVRLFVVNRDTPGLSVVPEPSMGVRGAGLGHLKLEGARVSDDALLGGPGADNPFDIGVLVDRARIAWGALAVGTAQSVLDYVIPYVNARQAFGEPISNRQSVAFLVADIAIEVEGMRLLVLRAASLAERGKSTARAATLARQQCASKGMKIGSDGVQLLGGHGFIKEHPVERWYRNLRAVGVFEGGVLA